MGAFSHPANAKPDHTPFAKAFYQQLVSSHNLSLAAGTEHAMEHNILFNEGDNEDEEDIASKHPVLLKFIGALYYQFVLNAHDKDRVSNLAAHTSFSYNTTQKYIRHRAIRV